jgi:hypothetical protein
MRWFVLVKAYPFYNPGSRIKVSELAKKLFDLKQ